ncbi:MAG: S-layer homology domain-containing protein [Oscillospiraceae bacterium]|nr:S-layer homology domain-containing protein [Oscillospiraceae bacterium]
MKKCIRAAIAGLVTLAMAIPVFAEPANTEALSRFSDINTDNFSWARGYIEAMAEKGLITGYEDGTFRPDNDVTRLEALSLFARAMGSVDPVNEPIIKIAHEKYDSIIDGYNLRWGTNEIAYLMYRGALKRADLDTYLKGNEKDTPMKRYEAAIIITKAMGGEEKALSDLGVALDYTDSREVPSNAIQYVAYASEAGIMEGMGEGSFSPNTEVKRSQMSVMLSRTVDKTGYSFRRMKLMNVNSDKREITVIDEDGEENKYVYTDDTVMRRMGDETQPKDLDTNLDAIFVFSDKTLVGVEVISAVPDKTVRGQYVSYVTTSGKTTIRVTDEEGETQSYECAGNIVVTYDGSPATVRSFTKGDIIILSLVDGKVAAITGETKTSTISGAIVEKLDIANGVKMTISHGNSVYDGQTYEVSEDVTVKKNDATTGLDSIYTGDRVTLTLQYGVITKISATSSKKTVEGTIKALTIASPNSTMTVRVDSEDKEYEIPRDVEILINGDEGSLYDFRIGDLVKITVESDAIIKIVATSTQESSGSMKGVVTAINTSFGVVSIMPEGVTDGEARNVYCKDETTTFVSVDGKSKKMKDVKVGQTVRVDGTVSNGVFVGKLFTIVAE